MPELAKIAEEAASDPVKSWTCDAEVRQPYVKTHNVWGARYDVDKLVTSDGWKNLRTWGAQNGSVAPAKHDGVYRCGKLTDQSRLQYRRDRLRASLWAVQTNRPARKVSHNTFPSSHVV